MPPSTTIGVIKDTRTATRDVLLQLRTVLAALQWTNPPSGGAQVAFGNVQIFDMTDLGKALNELLMMDSDRVCLVVLDRERWVNETRGWNLHCQQVRDVTLVFADRHWADRQKALLGDYAATPPNPGALTLMNIAVAAVCGRVLFDVRCEPNEADPGGLSRVGEMQGRIVVFQNLVLTGGEIVFGLGKAPIV
jgi:hypothetical protein